MRLLLHRLCSGVAVQLEVSKVCRTVGHNEDLSRHVVQAAHLKQPHPSQHLVELPRSLVPAARELLGVSAVWHNSTADLAAQRFVLWASRLLEAQEGDAAVAYFVALHTALEALAVEEAASSAAAAGGNGSGSSPASSNGSHGSKARDGNSRSAAAPDSLQGNNGAQKPPQKRRRLPLSVLVHCEMDGPPVELLASRSLLQVGCGRFVRSCGKAGHILHSSMQCAASCSAIRHCVLESAVPSPVFPSSSSAPLSVNLI